MEPVDIKAFLCVVYVLEEYHVFVEAENEKEAKERAEKVRITKGSRVCGGPSFYKVIKGCYLPIEVAKTHKEGWKYYG